MNVIPNFLRNASEIIRELDNHQDKFYPRIGEDRHASIIPNLYSKFKTLKDKDMSKNLIDLIFADNDFDPDLKDLYNFIQIQKYDIGDYIIPHRDAYSITKLHLVTLTTSTIDGLVCETVDHDLIKIYDNAGQYIDFPYESYHWVDPVANTRYSMVIAE